MMWKDFSFSPGGGDDDHDGDSRDEAFAYWDDPHVDGWRALGRVVRQGTAPAASRWIEGRTDRPETRVAPPAANRLRTIEAAAVPWYAMFERRDDGRWYCTIFVECCD